MKTSEKIDKLLPDLFKVKASILPLKKEAENPYFSSSYVDLNGVLDGVEPILEKNGFILLQPVSGRIVETVLLHSSGQFISSDMELVLSKNDMQALGSAVSYARRYSLMSLLGLKALDDDGNSATYEKAPAAKAKQSVAAVVKPSAVATPASTVASTTAKSEAKVEAPVEAKPVAAAKAAPSPKKFFTPKAKPASNGASSDASQFD